ncbi:hypothetical protein ACWGH3_37355 [Streptomyces sp. NPDC054884]
MPWRNLPREGFGPWQPVWKRHRGWAADGSSGTASRAKDRRLRQATSLEQTGRCSARTTHSASTPEWFPHVKIGQTCRGTRVSAAACAGGAWRRSDGRGRHVPGPLFAGKSLPARPG